jgi:hypothetical protein
LRSSSTATMPYVPCAIDPRVEASAAAADDLISSSGSICSRRVAVMPVI